MVQYSLFVLKVTLNPKKQTDRGMTLPILNTDNDTVMDGWLYIRCHIKSMNQIKTTLSDK